MTPAGGIRASQGTFSSYISFNFNFIFLNLIENTLSRTKSAVVHLIEHYTLTQYRLIIR